MLRKINFLILCSSLSFSAYGESRSERVSATINPETIDRSLPEFDSSKIFFNRVTKHMQMPDFAKIVLVGWDAGRASQYVAEKYDDAKVLNYVLSPEIQQYTELQISHPRIQTRSGDILMPEKDLKQSADVVFSSWVVGHVPERKQVIALKSMRFMLKEEGTCAVLYPMEGSVMATAIESVTSRPEWSKRFEGKDIPKRASYRPDQYAELMKRAGFEHIKSEKQTYSVYFSDRSELEAFVLSSLNRYTPYLEGDDLNQLVGEVTDAYLSKVAATPQGSIPYHVDMVIATAKNPAKI